MSRDQKPRRMELARRIALYRLHVISMFRCKESENLWCLGALGIVGVLVNDDWRTESLRAKVLTKIKILMGLGPPYVWI